MKKSEKLLVVVLILVLLTDIALQLGVLDPEEIPASYENEKL